MNMFNVSKTKSYILHFTIFPIFQNNAFSWGQSNYNNWLYFECYVELLIAKKQLQSKKDLGNDWP